MSKKTIDFDKIFIKNEREKDKEEKEHEEIQIKMTIKGNTKEMFEKLKEFYNLGYNSEVIRFIIKKVHDFEFNKGND